MRKTRLAITILIAFLVLASSAGFACVNCYPVSVPDPNGGPPELEMVCLNLGTDGFYFCADGGLVGTLFGCDVKFFCFADGLIPRA